MEGISLTKAAPLGPVEGIIALILLGLAMLSLAYYAKWKLVRNTHDFGIAGRQLGLGFGIAGLLSVMPITVGTAADIADTMEYYLDEGGADGFMLVDTYPPGCFEEFVDLVVPELQRRGRYRTAYPGTTLRENLLAD